MIRPVPTRSSVSGTLNLHCCLALASDIHRDSYYSRKCCRLSGNVNVNNNQAVATSVNGGGGGSQAPSVVMLSTGTNGGPIQPQYPGYMPPMMQQQPLAPTYGRTDLQYPPYNPQDYAPYNPQDFPPYNPQDYAPYVELQSSLVEPNRGSGRGASQKRPAQGTNGKR